MPETLARGRIRHVARKSGSLINVERATSLFDRCFRRLREAPDSRSFLRIISNRTLIRRGLNGESFGYYRQMHVDVAANHRVSR